MWGVLLAVNIAGWRHQLTATPGSGATLIGHGIRDGQAMIAALRHRLITDTHSIDPPRRRDRPTSTPRTASTRHGPHCLRVLPKASWPGHIVPEHPGAPPTPTRGDTRASALRTQKTSEKDQHIEAKITHLILAEPGLNATASAPALQCCSTMRPAA